MELIFEKLEAEVGIKTNNIGHLNRRCPKCSDTRKKKFASPLSIDITEVEAKGFCHHCGYSFVLSTAAKPKQFKTPEKPKLDSERAEGWFKTRGIPKAIIDRNKIGYIKTFMPQVESEVGTVAFPYIRGGEIVNIKYRTTTKQFRMEQGAELILYGVDDIDSKEVTIVEGEIDKLSLEVAGITSAISVPAGAPPLTAKNPNLDYLNEPKLDGVKKIIVAVDTDAPGRKLSSELIRRLGAERCYTVEWPEGTKDANEVLLKFGAEKLKEFIQNAKPVPIVGLIEASNLKTNIHDIYENGHQPGESPGTDALSHYYTVKPGQMSIVTGIPSSGKSAWVDWVMYSLAKNSHWKFGVCSPENYPIEEHIIKLIELRSGKAFYGNNKLSKQKVDDNLSWVNEHFYFLAQEEEVKDWSIKGVLDMAKALVKRKGINGLVLDPWNEFDHTRTNGMSETEHISRSLSEIRQFARNYNCHVWVVAHPFKLRKLESGDYPVPTLYDIAGSAHFYNKADMGVSISRDPKNPTLPVTIAVQKVRFKRCGVVGEHLMTYDFANNRYDDYTQL